MLRFLVNIQFFVRFQSWRIHMSRKREQIHYISDSCCHFHGFSLLMRSYEIVRSDMAIASCDVMNNEQE